MCRTERREVKACGRSGPLALIKKLLFRHAARRNIYIVVRIIFHRHIQTHHNRRRLPNSEEPHSENFPRFLDTPHPLFVAVYRFGNYLLLWRMYGCSRFLAALAPAVTDAQARERFLADPKAVLAAAGLDLPESFKVSAREGDAAELTITLPPLRDPDADLSDELLAAVSGGGVWAPWD